MKNIAIIGSGSWGVALGVHLAKLGNSVKIWSFAQEEADLINNEKKCKFLPMLEIPEGITCTTSYEEAVVGSDIIIHVTPSKFTRNIVKGYKEYVTNQPIIICTKGFESDTLMTLDDVIKEEIPGVKVAALSGPSHAEEVSIALETAVVLACEDINLANELRDVFMNERLRIYTSTDVKGVELGGALKNIIAFCAGIAAGIGLGDNSFAALITRGLHEISALGEALGGNKQSFYGLSGLGDLIVTCLSEHSRNRRAGKLLGQGKKLEDIRTEIGMVIEGVDNIEVAYKLAQIHNIDMPIVNVVYKVLFEELDPKTGVKMLMTRDKKSEI